MSRKQLQNERLRLIADLEERLGRRVSAAQEKLYSRLLELVADLSTDEGIVKFTASNQNIQRRVRTVIETFHREVLAGTIRWLTNRVKEVLTLNVRYFKAIDRRANITGTVNRVLKGLGYEDGKLIPNSRLFNLLNDNSTLTRVSRLFSNAVNGSQTLTRLREGLRNLVKNPRGLGELQRRFFQNANDVFAEADRSVQLQAANQLGYNFLIWAHTPKDTSTEFCLMRSNRLFTREFAERWDIELEWKGKKDGNNVFIDGHGFNCRSTINWISDELAESLMRTLPLNTFNAVAA